MIIYAYASAAIVSLLVGIFMLSKSTHLKVRVFFWLCISFFIWIISSAAGLFPSLGREIMLTAKLVSIASSILILILSSYFLYILIRRKDSRIEYKLGWLLPLIPLFGTVIAGNAHLLFDPFSYTAFPDENLSIAIYAVSTVYLAFIVIFGISEMIRNAEYRDEILVSFLGVATFTGIFFISEHHLSEDYLVAGIFALPLALSFMAYLAMKFKVIKMRIVTAQVLIISVFILIFAQFFFFSNPVQTALNGMLLIFMSVIAAVIFSDFKREINEKEEIEKLAGELTEKNHEMKLANIKLKDLDAQKTEFVSLATHQLRGPLTSLKGFASMILQGDYGQPTEGIRKTVELMARSIQSLSVVVGDYLDVSRMEQGEMKYDFSVFDLKAVARIVVQEFTPVAESVGLKIKLECDENTAYNIRADMGKIKQVIGNLVDNSIKYTPSGVISVCLQKWPGKKIILSVKDSGIGIDHAVIPHLFARYSRAPEASKTNILGTGLGLYVVRKMVEAHQGKIWVESEGVGKGTEFFVELWEV